MSKLRFVPDKNPIHRINAELLRRLINAQNLTIENQFKSAEELFSQVASDLKLSIAPPAELSAKSALDFSEAPFNSLISQLVLMLAAAEVPESARLLHATNFAYRVHLIRAFSEPDRVLKRVSEKVGEIVSTFPATAEDIERGRNPGDVLDPYILAATQILLCQNSFQDAMEATVAHKALMIIEGLLGHLHEEVIGEMRGNIKAPEPRGINQEIIDLDTNPFPGADVVQPPLKDGETLRVHQVKSKTGSAKGGDGRRLGAQLKVLNQYYGAEVYYDALIGNTLRGHRSMNGVLTEAPQVIVLVGEAAFQSLTRSKIGPELLLRVYQAAFSEIAHTTGYHIDAMASGIVETFKARAESAGSGFLEVLLRDATAGPIQQQDSRNYRSSSRRRP